MKDTLKNIISSLFSGGRRRLYGPAFERAFSAFAKASGEVRREAALVPVRATDRTRRP